MLRTRICANLSRRPVQHDRSQDSFCRLADLLVPLPRFQEQSVFRSGPVRHPRLGVDITHIIIKTSLFKKFHSPIKSALDKNFRANANSKNPRVTFKVFIQPPDLGIFLINLGKNDKIEKGTPKANPKPSIPKVNSVGPLEFNEPASRDPKIGPVHEKETIDNVKAIKKIPKIFLREEEDSDLLAQELGREIS